MRLLALAFVALTFPAYAADPPCLTVDVAVAAAEEMNGGLVDLIDVNGENVDQLLFVEAGGTIQMTGVKGGCLVGPVMQLDAVRSKGQPA